MEQTSGIYKIFSNPLIYHVWQRLSGSSHARRYFVENYVRIRVNESIVDIGCGPGHLLAYMPTNVSYVGIDISERYISAAQKKYGGRGKFIQGDCDLAGKILPHGFADAVLCCGVLHHIDDAVIKSVFENSYKLLKPGGRFLCLEPVWLPDHPLIARLHMKLDRGKNIKTEGEWLGIARAVYSKATAVVRTNLFTLPYCVLILTCNKEA